MQNTIFRKGNFILGLFFVLILLMFNFFVFVAETSAAENKLEDYFAEDMLMIGMVDLSLLINNPSANIEDVNINDQFTKEIVVNGRTAFFLKGKIKGEYLLTLKVDTGQGEIDELLEGLLSPESRNTISRIDPERYYPVYGDNSSMTNMVNSRGKIYLQIVGNDKEILWGDYSYNLDGNQLIPYNRSLYGLNIKIANNEGLKKKQGKSDGPFININTEIEGFWSKAESVHSYNELEVTGGSLYYLKYGNLIVGSENIKLEFRDKISSTVEKTIELKSAVDYQIDYLSGRLILNGNIKDDYQADLSNDDITAYVVANYEYDPVNNIAAAAAYGLDFSVEKGNSTVNAAFLVDESVSAKRYQSTGLSYNYQDDLSDLTIEWASSENELINQYYSSDGGMEYQLKTNSEEETQANAYIVKYNTNLKDINDSFPELEMTAEYQHKDKGFSSQRENIKEDVDSFKLEARGGKEDKISYTASYYNEKKEIAWRNLFDLKLSKQINNKLKLAAKLRQDNNIDEESNNTERLNAGIDFRYKIDDGKEVYGSQNLALKGGDNSKTTLGAKFKPMDRLSIDTAITFDSNKDTDQNIKIGGNYQYKYGEVYTAFETRGSADNSVILGANTSLGEKTDIQLEHKTSIDEEENNNSDLIGIKYQLNNWSLALDYSRSNVEKNEGENLSRDIITPAAVYRGEDMNYRVKMEYRQDRGSEEMKQYVLTSGLDMQYNKELTAFFNLNYSLTQRADQIDENDSFTEGQLGMAYRPIDNDKLNLLAMYTYQEEYKPVAQENVGEYSESRNILSLEGIYDINSRWQLGEKVAWKNSKIVSKDIANDSTINAVSDTYLWINRLSYKAAEDWDVYGEYRILENKQAKDSKSGILLGVNKKLASNLKLGVGYNFTDFNDDLTELDYIYRGLFINLVKTW